MNTLRKVTYLGLSVLALIFLPWLGSLIRHKWSLPSDFFDYPPIAPLPKAPFNWTVFGIFCFLFLGTLVLYFFPRIFGFKKLPSIPKVEVRKVKLPIWFWIGLVTWGGTLFLLWTKSTHPIWLLHWSDLPLFWGFAIMLDGWVYKRNGGNSLISRFPQEVVGIGVASVGGWMLFEFLNFFVNDNWYYPMGHIISREQFLLYAIVISSGLIPAAFIWYSFFQTFPNFMQRYSNGIKLVFPEWLKTLLIFAALGGLIGSGMYPNDLFFALWVAPPLLLAVVLDKCGVWTPLRSIGQGNWSPTMIFALTYLAEGLVLECQNYFSAIKVNGVVKFAEDPAYWQYNLPWVNDFHLFEMPFLGFMGYLPFGVYCWVWWITFATLLGIPSIFYKEKALPKIPVSANE